MSIIYDALKKIKTKTSGPQDTQNKEKKQKRSLFYPLIYVLMAVIGVYVANFIFDLFKATPPKPMALAIGSQTTASRPVALSAQANLTAINLTAQETAETEPPALEPQELRKLSVSAEPEFRLNGILYDAEAGSIAIINNQILREGDSIEGAKLVSILRDEIELEFEGKTINLKIKN